MCRIGNMHSTYTLGIGIKLAHDFELTDKITIRPYSIKYDHLQLMDHTLTKSEYGFICSLSDLVTFEMECKGNDAKSAAIQGWNSQWALVLLSVILRKPIYWPLSRMPATKARKEIYNLSNIFIGPSIFKDPYEIPSEKLDLWKSKYPKFDKMMDNPRFSSAAAIACNHFHEPRLSIRIAAIWAGIESIIGLDQELRFRIALYISKLFGQSESEREKIFADTKKLYDGRSRCVHGSGFKTRAAEKKIYTESLELLCNLILKICQIGKMPKPKDIESIILS